ncbi:MAG: pitrilysin family protein [Bacteroidota bacterium]
MGTIRLDRSLPPLPQSIQDITFAWPERMQLQSGMPCFFLNNGQQPIVKLEVLFASGSWYEPVHGVAYFTAKMLRMGTRTRTAQQIAAYLDYYGADLSIQVKPDHCSLGLTVLAKYLTPTLALLTELLLEPTFPPAQLDLLKNLTLQHRKVKLEKPNYVARKRFREAIFGKAHPYGHKLTAEEIQAIVPEQLHQYHQQHLLADGQVLISGQVSQAHLRAVDDHFQHLPIQQAAVVTHPGPVKKATQGRIAIKENSLQSAIYIGKTLFTKQAPDYLGMHFVSVLLGGYFGSRLMRNIREEKGYTYGIYSHLTVQKHMTHFYIATEVMQAFTEETCREIYREVEVLQTERVAQSELEQLRSYMMGHFLTTVHHPFGIMERFKGVHLHGLDRGFYDRFYDTVCGISSEAIQRLASEYLDRGSLTEVVVG